MKKMLLFLSAVLIAMMAGHIPVWGASAVNVSISPSSIQANMGDKITYTGTITNDSGTAITGLIAYISLANVTKGNEAPMDLEDWSVAKAAKFDLLAPHATREIKWPMRLINSGSYIIYVTVVAGNSKTPVSSAVSRLEIKRVLRLNPNNVLPVALGEPILIALIFGIIRFRRNKTEG
jgi:hypothetical protein